MATLRRSPPDKLVTLRSNNIAKLNVSTTASSEIALVGWRSPSGFLRGARFTAKFRLPSTLRCPKSRSS